MRREIGDVTSSSTSVAVNIMTCTEKTTRFVIIWGKWKWFTKSQYYHTHVLVPMEKLIQKQALPVTNNKSENQGLQNMYMYLSGQVCKHICKVTIYLQKRGKTGKKPNTNRFVLNFQKQGLQKYPILRKEDLQKLVTCKTYLQRKMFCKTYMHTKINICIQKTTTPTQKGSQNTHQGPIS